MAGFIGMDPEQIKTIARKVEGEATKIQTDVTTVGNNITAAQWKGPDREKFVAEWAQQKAQVAKVCDMLRATARNMIANADQQTLTSSR